MAWIYLAASAESPLPWLPGSDQSHTVRSTDTLRLYCSHAWVPDSFPPLQSGTTLQPSEKAAWSLIKNHPSTSFTAVFPARTSALRAMVLAWRESEAAYSARSLGSLASYDRLSSSWKTCQQSLLAEGGKWSEPLPRWGMTVDGVLSALRPLEPPIDVKDSSYWPTLVARDYRNSKIRNRGNGSGLDLVAFLSQYHGGKSIQLKPSWCEKFMGYPEGWTELSAWAMEWFRPKRKRHSKS